MPLQWEPCACECPVSVPYYGTGGRVLIRIPSLTPEGARADAAATPARTRDTLHVHGVADTAKRQRGPRLNSKARVRAAKRARAADDD